MTRVLGLDPGFLRLGFGAVKSSSEELALIGHGVITNPRSAGDTFNAYLNSGIQRIATDFPRLIDVTEPHIIVSEVVPTGRLGSNTELVIAAITTCKVIAFQFGIEWHDVAANTVKKQIAGEGTATKARIKNAVLDLFPEIDLTHQRLKREQKAAGEKAVGLPADVFDGLAVAVTGARLYGNCDEEV